MSVRGSDIRGTILRGTVLRGNVFAELSVREMSVGENSVREMSSGNCPRTNALLLVSNQLFTNSHRVSWEYLWLEACRVTRNRSQQEHFPWRLLTFSKWLCFITALTIFHALILAIFIQLFLYLETKHLSSKYTGVVLKLILTKPSCVFQEHTKLLFDYTPTVASWTCFHGVTRT